MEGRGEERRGEERRGEEGDMNRVRSELCLRWKHCEGTVIWKGCWFVIMKKLLQWWNPYPSLKLMSKLCGPLNRLMPPKYVIRSKVVFEV
jgi:hypothetical protein